MKNQKDLTLPSSFAFFTQVDDPNFIHYLETYYGEYERKEK